VVLDSLNIACAICNGFQGKWKAGTVAESQRRRGNRNHIIPRFTWDELQSSAKSCYCCSILESGCRGCFDQHGIRESDILHGSLRFIYPFFSDTADEEDADKELTFLLADGRRFEIELFATESDDCPIPDSWDYLPVSRRTSPRTDSTIALATIKDWIEECITTHTLPDEGLCDPPTSSYLPTRVVDVGLDDGVVKLVETKAAEGTYLCLSHCWGLTEIITTTRSTYEERKRRIAWEDLSNTFRDAISLTRTLGFKYIWIDSLCIVQDDYRDWEIESANMASVYRNSHLTIAATRSANGHGGLFSRTEDFEVFGKTPDGEDYFLYFRERIDHHIENSESDEFPGYPTLTYHPLLTRAWVYQERMLSPRVLHFGRYEVSFECRSLIQCECGSIPFYGISKVSPVPLIKLEHATSLWDYRHYREVYGDQYRAEVEYQGARLWRTMICSYTALLLTKSKDRLPAIGGLAKEMAAVRKSRYLAGLWEDALNDDLLWTINATSKYKKPRPFPRNAPTWSWASVETWTSYWDEISFSTIEEGNFEERLPYEHFSKIEHCEVNWSAIDEFGSIAHGSLTISGLVAKGILEREVEIQDDAESIVHYVSFPNTRLAMKSDYLLDFEGPGQTSPMISVFCLRMSLIQEGPTDNLISLVLKRSPEFPDCFERIGTLTISGSRGSVDSKGGVFDTAELQTIVIV